MRLLGILSILASVVEISLGVPFSSESAGVALRDLHRRDQFTAGAASSAISWYDPSGTLQIRVYGQEYNNKTLNSYLVEWQFNSDTAAWELSTKFPKPSIKFNAGMAAVQWYGPKNDGNIRVFYCSPSNVLNGLMYTDDAQGWGPDADFNAAQFPCGVYNLAAVQWENGKHIRLYNQNPQSHIVEFQYNDKSGWENGDGLGDAYLGTQVAATVYGGNAVTPTTISVFYQVNTNSGDVVGTEMDYEGKGPWKQSDFLWSKTARTSDPNGALPGTALAVTSLNNPFDDTPQIRLVYGASAGNYNLWAQVGLRWTGPYGFANGVMADNDYPLSLTSWYGNDIQLRLYFQGLSPSNVCQEYVGQQCYDNCSVWATGSVLPNP